MLGWMLKRGDHAPDPDDGDTTQIDQPDTPAPVFAARAFKSALFGTPSKRSQARRRHSQGSSSTSKSRSLGTPLKPQGILLTPGTGASKRKRVTFGHDVPGGSTLSLDRITELDESIETQPMPTSQENKRSEDALRVSDDDWEEEDDEEGEGEDEGNSSRDVTLDLNEPHSQSGQYWKEQFLRYHQEARAEMEKLLKYKQLAKSYAQQKDAEAIQLAERLRDEQQRVINMEKKIAENASQIASHRQQSSGQDPPDLLDKLTKQTTLVAQYRHRVQDLEAQMEELRMQRDSAATTDNETPRRRHALTPCISTTQKTLTETRRELRRARSQLKELDSLRDEVFGLKMQLKKAELRLAVNEKEEARATSSGPRAQELRTLLKAARDESKRKDDELRQLKADFQAYMTESEARDADTKAVLERAHAKITELKKEVKSLKATGSGVGAGAGAGAGAGGARPHSWHSNTINNDAAAEIKETKSDELMRRNDNAQAAERRSLDGSADVTRHRAQQRTLREKFRDDAAAAWPPSQTQASTGTAGRTDSEKPKWQPFVPRSPRNRSHFSDDVAVVKNIAPPELPILTKSEDRGTNAAAGGGGGGVKGGQIDLLSSRFARLGGPGPNNHMVNSSMVGNTSKSNLPPERRAAARAKIEKSMAERKKLRALGGAPGKENLRP
ncbi:hypothetical protein E4U43_002795 [Claviceps pusilla]|uniref:Spindle pole body-associated protein cut12 domain-containing protein n=1 Tax=Claviceps pusilla TaxID=123648 RepID=A0A9P7SX93_9HYPO|nr:hypothetical protein E4U43_002795 [Claviceps pusilla]